MALVPTLHKKDNDKYLTINRAKADYVGETNPYHIRREDQLRKITVNYFPTKKYIQDCGFTVSGSLPENTVTAFSGTYDATFEKNKNKRYNIQHKGTGDSTKLFDKVTGTVKAQINGNTVNQP